MSAFLCSDAHINALIHGAIQFGRVHSPWDWRDQAECTRMAQLLVTENYRSVNTRYGKADAPHAITYRRRAKDLTQVEILKLCDCYDYQSCETDDYRQTAAAKFIDWLRGEVICSLPGYAAAPWAIE